MKDLLRTADLSHDDLVDLVDLAVSLRHHPRCPELAGHLVVLYLTEPSNRTRVTFSSAAIRLGASVVVIGPAEFQLGRGADVRSIARAVSAYGTVVVARTTEPNLRRLADEATIPVVNGLSEHHQPCQGLADLLTLHDSLGHVDGLRVGYVGDGRNMGRSVLDTSALPGVRITVATPPGQELDAAVAIEAWASAVRGGGDLRLTGDVAEAVTGADAVYISPDPARQHEPMIDELLALAAPGAPLLVSQPACLGSEARRTIVTHPRSRLRQQADGRGHAAVALLVAAHRGQFRGISPATLAAVG